MGKILLLLTLGVAIWWLWRKAQAGQMQERPAPAPRPAELMVSCAHCGVNQPRSECVESGGHLYCSEAHRHAAERGAGGA